MPEVRRANRWAISMLSPMQGGVVGERVTMAEHELKSWPEFFDAVAAGSKRFEMRKFDRGFSVDDTLLLRRWDPDNKKYTGESLRVRVTYITNLWPVSGSSRGLIGPGVKDYCVMSIAPISDDEPATK